MINFFKKFISPLYFYKYSRNIYLSCISISFILVIIGLYMGFFVAPIDYLQGNSYRILFIHVPAAWLSMGIYFYMAILAFIFLVWRIKIANILAYSSSLVGASFTLLTLITGSIWGKPTWGSWWVWDARLTSELILLLFYFAYIGLYNAIDNEDSARKISSILLIIGVINLPIIHYSVIWWNTLHQAPSILKFSTPSIHIDMLIPLFIMFFSFLFFYIAITIYKASAIVLFSEQKTKWVKDIIKNYV